MKKIIALTLIVMLTIMGASVSAESNSTADIVSQYENEILESFNELGIDFKTQQKLLDKIKNGETIDSMKPENIEKALEISQSTPMNESTTLVFSDGSRIIFGSEIVSYEGDSVGDVGLNKFKERSPGTYEIKTYWYAGIINSSYYTDATIKKGKNNDVITRAYSGSASIIGGRLESEKVSISARYETSTHYAHSQYKVVYSLVGGIAGGGTLTLNTLVGNNGYETSTGGISSRK
ncbi:hypothetical protein [Paucisalibacillus globulus]|uniref:hypothetical protein n=1 Tax=Paucisalibacillus globulus TaxID=351095 RepID=UPI000BB70B5E|nr:hypothetical protein [Paucisalibacillus globulus]